MPYPVAPVNNIGFIIIVIIGAIAAYGVAAVLRRALSLKYFKQYPEAKDLLGLGIGALKAFYGRSLLYPIFLLIAIAIIVQPSTNVTSVIYAFGWSLATAFALAVILLAYLLVKRIAKGI